jgi:molecular chaperone GrpE (heat shock protein)
MQHVGTNPPAGLPDLHFDSLNPVSADDGSEYPLTTAFEPWDTIRYYTQLTDDDVAMAMDPNLLRTPTSSGLRSEHDSQFLMFPMDESPIVSEASPNTSSTPSSSVTGKEQNTARNNTCKRGPQNSRSQTEKKEQVKQRNRVAASKCRQKKRTKADELKEQSSSLEADNNNLHNEYERLRKEIGQVKSDLMHHTECNDDNINQWISNEAKTYVDKLVRKEVRQRMGSLSSSNETVEDVENAQPGLPFGMRGMSSRGSRLG